MPKVFIAYGHKRIYYDREKKPKLDQNILSTVLDVEQCLLQKGHKVHKAALLKNPTNFLRSFLKFKPDVIFNLCEDIEGDARKEKAAVAFFEILSVPFTGNGTLPLAVCLDKAMTKRILLTAGIPTPPFRVITRPKDATLGFPFPAIVKPLREDGSLGITARSVVKTNEALRRRVQYTLRFFKQPALVEQYIPGREFQVSLLGNTRPKILAVSELSYRGLPSNLPHIVTYSAKWEPKSKYYKFTNPIVPASVDRALKKKLKDISTAVFDIFNLRGYARVDFRVEEDRPYVVDVNPNPDISPDAGLAKAAAHAGLPYADLIDKVVALAME